MEYSKIYGRLIKRAQTRVSLIGYSESHHIFPKCFFVKQRRTRFSERDRPENLVRLTGKEHVLAHILLHKMFPDNRGLAVAVIATLNGVKRQSGGSILYSCQEAKRIAADTVREQVKDPEFQKLRLAGLERVRIKRSDNRQHGTREKYRFDDCRCDFCIEAIRKYDRDRYAKKAHPRAIQEHGTYARYSTGCRCDLCVEENRRYHREFARVSRAKMKLALAA